MTKKRGDDNWILIVLFLLFLLIIYVASLGKVDVGTNLSFDEFKENKEQAKHRHDKLKALLEKKEALKTKLTKRFNRIYLAVRFCFVVLWGLYLFGLYRIGWVQNLEDAINYSEAAILVWLAFNFLTFGNLSNLNNFLNLIKMKLQNWIWGKYIDIDESIGEYKLEIETCQVTIQKYD